MARLHRGWGAGCLAARIQISLVREICFSVATLNDVVVVRPNQTKRYLHRVIDARSLIE
jgi:hypothetical protein